MLTNSAPKRNSAWRRAHILSRNRSCCSTASLKAQLSDPFAIIDRRRAPIDQSHLLSIPRLHAAHASSHIQGCRRDLRSSELQSRQPTTMSGVSMCHHWIVTTSYNNLARSGEGSTHVAWLLFSAFIVMARTDKLDDPSRRIGAGLLNVNLKLLACCSLRGQGAAGVAGCEGLSIWMIAPWVSASSRLTCSTATIEAGKCNVLLADEAVKFGRLLLISRSQGEL
jgi:hypothetical protein